MGSLGHNIYILVFRLCQFSISNSTLETVSKSFLSISTSLNHQRTRVRSPYWNSPQSYQIFKWLPSWKVWAVAAVGPAAKVAPSQEADQDPNHQREFLWRKIKVVAAKSARVKSSKLISIWAWVLIYLLPGIYVGEYQKQAWVFVGEIASISSQESEMSRFLLLFFKYSQKWCQIVLRLCLIKSQ